MTTFAPAEVEVEQPIEADDPEHDRPWVVIVWNDPINLMSYVTLVFREALRLHAKPTRRS